MKRRTIEQKRRRERQTDYVRLIVSKITIHIESVVFCFGFFVVVVFVDMYI